VGVKKLLIDRRPQKLLTFVKKERIFVGGSLEAGNLSPVEKKV
jgi:hypothetical protein